MIVRSPSTIAAEKAPTGPLALRTSATERGAKAAVTDEYADAVAEYTAHLEEREVDADPVDFFAPPPRRPHYTPDPRRYRVPAGRGAEEMSPDPVDEDEDLAIVEPREIEDEDIEASFDDRVGEKTRDERPSYLRSTAGPLFGGQTVADDLARRGAPPAPEDIDLGDDDDAGTAAPMSSFLRGAWVVGQCIIAVAFGAGLFIAFDQLWK